jgi:putative GTP pyrophosphokinase
MYPDFVSEIVDSPSRINKAGKRLAKLSAHVRKHGGVEGVNQAWLDALRDDLHVMDAFRARHARPLGATNANLRYYVRGYGRVNVTQRLKKFSTVLDKLLRYPSMPLATMEDIAGLRAVLPSQEAADEVSRRLRKNWQISRYRDYVRTPKASGYRALHLIAIKQGVFVEIQLRTALQDTWANQVEHDSRMLKVDYKSGVGEREVHDYYVAVGELFAAREAGHEPSDAFMHDLVSRYTLAKPFLYSARNL